MNLDPQIAEAVVRHLNRMLADRHIGSSSDSDSVCESELCWSRQDKCRFRIGTKQTYSSEAMTTISYPSRRVMIAGLATTGVATTLKPPMRVTPPRSGKGTCNWNIRRCRRLQVRGAVGVTIGAVAAVIGASVAIPAVASCALLLIFPTV